MQQTALGYGSALLATVIWSGNFVVARALATLIPPWQCNFWRWLVALVVLLPFARRHLKRDWPGIRRHWLYLSLMAVLGVTLMNTLIYKAGQTTESLNMALLVPTAPIVILLFSRVIYGEPITPRRLAGMLVVLAGVIILVSRGDWQRLAGLRINSGDFCQGSWAARSASGSTRCSCASAPAMCRPWASMWRPSVWVCSIPCPSLWPRPACPCPRFPRPWSRAFCTPGWAVPHSFWFWTLAVDRIGPMRGALFTTSLPVFAAVASVLVLGESIAPRQVQGACWLSAASWSPRWLFLIIASKRNAFQRS